MLYAIAMGQIKYGIHKNGKGKKRTFDQIH